MTTDAEDPANEHPTLARASFEETLERLLIDLYEIGMLHGETQSNGVGVTLLQRETAVVIALTEIVRAHQDSVREIIGEDWPTNGYSYATDRKDKKAWLVNSVLAEQRLRAGLGEVDE